MNKPKTVTHACCESADKILTESQGVPSHSSGNPGHPRYHVLCNPNFNKVQILSDLPNLGCTEAVTETLGNTKSAFLNREDQNAALHDVLTMDIGRAAIQKLNEGRNEILVRTPVSALPTMRHLEMVEVMHGERLERQPAKALTLILGHHESKPEGKYVHVKTFYPMSRYVHIPEMEILH